MAVDLRPWTAIVILGLVLAFGTAGSAVVADVTSDPALDANSEYLTMSDPAHEEATYLWPYTSQTTAYESRTLAINAIVFGDPAVTERQLRESRHSNWDEDHEDADLAEGQANVNGTATAWHSAQGSTRYVPIKYGDERVWLTESYQLHDGDYLGTRHHIRAYTPSERDEDWTAIQSHREHWDWFQLRHTVDSVEESQIYLEEEFMDAWFVGDLWREYVGNDDGSDSNGWMTIVELDTGEGGEMSIEDSSAGEPASASSDSDEYTLRSSSPDERMIRSGGPDEQAMRADPARDRPTEERSSVAGLVASIPDVLTALLGAMLGLLVIGATATGRLGQFRDDLDAVFPRDIQRAVGLGGGIVALYLFVRFGSIGAERLLPLTPKMIVGVFYPFIFAGVPIFTYLLARQLDKPLAFAGASIGFFMAIMLDYTYLGVAVLPQDVLIHRGTLAVALGLIAVGASRTERHASVEAGHVRTGVLMWLVALGLPLLRFV